MRASARARAYHRGKWIGAATGRGSGARLRPLARLSPPTRGACPPPALRPRWGWPGARGPSFLPDQVRTSPPPALRPRWLGSESSAGQTPRPKGRREAADRRRGGTATPAAIRHARPFRPHPRPSPVRCAIDALALALAATPNAPPTSRRPLKEPPIAKKQARRRAQQTRTSDRARTGRRARGPLAGETPVGR